MNLSQEHRELIESIIRQNPGFAGREEFMEQICAQVYKKSYLLLDSVSNLNNLKNYLSKVAENSIANVILANQAQLEEEQGQPVFHSLSGLKAGEEIPIQTQQAQVDNNAAIIDELTSDIETIIPEDIKSVARKKKPEMQVVNLKDSVQKTQATQKFTQLIDPIEFHPKKPVQPAIMANIIPTLKVINTKFPNKKFAQIFKMRHVQNMRQAAIARKLKISQSELSRRYCEMVKYLSQTVSSKN